MVRRLYTTAELYAGGVTQAELRWAARRGRLRAVARGVWVGGPAQPTALDRARAAVLRCKGEARGHLAGVLHELDSVELDDRPTRRARLADDRVVVVAGVRCADGLTTLVDLAATLDDRRWEHALEAALRKGLTTIAAIEAAVPALAAARTDGVGRIRRVLALREPGAPPTESLLETLMVQLARRVPGLGTLVRQYEVRDERGEVVARLDLCDPVLGFFIELDGEHHLGQPVYDASRETAVVAATGWLPGRFTWTEVTRLPTSTARRLSAIAEQARRRPAA